MAYTYKSADFVFFLTSVAPLQGALERLEMYTKHSLGHIVPPVGQFMYKTKILFLLPIDSVKPINRMEDECLGALKTEKYDNLMDKCHALA